MATIHFLNVKDGDCSWIKHNSSNVTVIDVNNASKTEDDTIISETAKYATKKGGNHNQKEYPVNPIQYLKDFNVTSIFRFILTHPDMDHMGGLKDLFDCFGVYNFWDTDNNKELTSFTGPYKEEDWTLYKNIRDGKNKSLTRLTLYAGVKGQYYNMADDRTSGGDGLTILAPTKELVDEANRTCNYNDSSYVILYRTAGKKIVFAGDSEDKTWEHILENYESDVTDVDILIAPHHGRDSDRNYKFLDVLKPKITFFGNAKSEHLGYSGWTNRGLKYYTNNQANCLIVDLKNNTAKIFATYEVFAKKENPNSYYDSDLKAWYLLAL